MSGIGPTYGIKLIKSLPISYGDNQGMLQAMPSRSDLQGVKEYKQGCRVVAGYEILLNTWRMQGQENARLKAELADAKTKNRNGCTLIDKATTDLIDAESREAALREAVTVAVHTCELALQLDETGRCVASGILHQLQEALAVCVPSTGHKSDSVPESGESGTQTEGETPITTVMLVYNRALKPEEVAKLYRGLNGQLEPGEEFNLFHSATWFDGEHGPVLSFDGEQRVEDALNKGVPLSELTQDMDDEEGARQ